MDTSHLRVGVAGDVLRFSVHAKPRAKRSMIVGVREGALEVALAAPPVDGEANRELVETLARAFGVKKRDVTLVRGAGSREKVVEVRGIALDELRARVSSE